jgi:hypothetical protein
MLHLELDGYGSLVHGPEAALGFVWAEELLETYFEELVHGGSDLALSSTMVHEEVAQVLQGAGGGRIVRVVASVMWVNWGHLRFFAWQVCSSTPKSLLKWWKCEIISVLSISHVGDTLQNCVSSAMTLISMLTWMALTKCCNSQRQFYTIVINANVSYL